MADKEKLFRSITDVEVVESVNAEDTVLIEQDGVAKRAPKGSIGAQSDWNETDESSPAFIKNKPDLSSGGVTPIHFGTDGYCYVGTSDAADGAPITNPQFIDMFRSSVLVKDDGDSAALVVSYRINSTSGVLEFQTRSEAFNLITPED